MRGEDAGGEGADMSRPAKPEDIAAAEFVVVLFVVLFGIIIVQALYG
jgi:hypothetical protein